MKSSRLMKIFEQYVKKYDMNNSNIKVKYFHSLKTMELSRDMATTLGIFNEEEIVVCELSGLFHEIGSFNVNKNFKIIDEEDDNTEKTFDILFNQGLLRKITNITTYDDIIKIAILSYNKNGLYEGIDSKTASFCKVIQDVHKLDIFRMVINYPYLDTRIDTLPSSLVYNNFKMFKTINDKVSDNNADSILVILSSIFSFNYLYSYYLLRVNNYINKLISSLSFSSKEVQVFFLQLSKALNSYADKKINN